MKAMNSVRRGKLKPGFKSYIDSPLHSDDYHERPVDVPEESEEKVDPLLLPDEVVVAEVQHVLKFTSLRTQILGTLFVTNFKLSFVTASLPVDAKENDVHNECLHSDFLGLHDVSLTQIDTIICLPERKKLTPNTPLPHKIKGLQIILKSFRIMNFSFMNTSPRENVIKVTNALLVHRFPKKLDLLYLALDSPPPPCEIPDFITSYDWEKELQRTRCPNWRVSLVNEASKVFPTLPQAFVVPQCITDSDLTTKAHYFKGNRPLTWCWGNPRGAALVRMAQLAPTISAVMSPENQLIQMVHRSHSQKKVQPTCMDLDQMMPSAKAIQASFLKLKDLHTPDTQSSMSESEKSYLSRWQSSGWLSHVQKSLEVAQRAASDIATHNKSVILQEFEGRDLSCVVSSLVQILLDPFARTLRGFHALIQKEWVALGHPFCSRLGHLKPASEETCPLWLLFLDCLHQVANYHPAALEFTPEYLVALWQASHCSLHATFMFDSVKEYALTHTTLREENRSNATFLWPVWSWWARSEGVRSGLEKGNIAAQKRSLKRRQEDREKRLSTVSNDTTQQQSAVGAPFGSEGRELLTEERRLHHEERSLGRAGEVRWRARERFINILYVEDLLIPLLTPDALLRLADPLASVHSVWHRLSYLLGEPRVTSTLPYNPAISPTPLELASAEPVHVSPHWKVRPWIECFGFWMRGSATTPPPVDGDKTRPTLEPLQSQSVAHWSLVREIFALFRRLHLESPDRNGVGS